MKLVIGVPALLLSTSVVFGYLAFIWWLDRYEREPLWLVGLTFAWGAFLGTGLGCVVNSAATGMLSVVVGKSTGLALAKVAVAPLVEEATKGFVFVILIWNHNFDNETDGLIYGAATGLGFAVVENVLYFAKLSLAAQVGVGALIGMLIVRTLFTSLVHCISSALLGVAFGYARHRSGHLRWLVYPGLGYAAAVVHHGLWNGLNTMTSAFGSPQFSLVGMAMVVVLGVLMFAITQFSLHREHTVIEQFLRQEAEMGILPAEHAEIIPYWTKRRRDDWLPEDVSREEYVRAATLLAFRHHQRQLAGGERADQYRREIRQYRNRVRELLADQSDGA
ncbi:MAG: PrsW family intramembrane metalloprotease [Bradymonadaceae bacterium]